MKIPKRELDILKLMCSGHTGKQIAHILKLHCSTVRCYSTRLRKRTGSKSPQQLGVWAAKQGLV